MARQQQQQLSFDWGQSELPATPLSAASVPETPKPTPSPFNFKTSFPSPRDEAIGAGVFGGEAELDDEAVKTIHEEHGKELLAILLNLDVINDARNEGIDPRTGKAPRTDAGKQKLQAFFRTAPPRLEAHFQSLIDVYASGFGDEAAEHFEAFIHATHESRDFESEPLSHSPMPVPLPLEEAVGKGHFGMEDEHTPVDPSPEEVSAITELHGERIVELLEQLETLDEQLAVATGENRTLLIAQKDKTVCAYQGTLALYSEDFGEVATELLVAWARSQLGVPRLHTVESTTRLAQSEHEPYAGIGCTPPKSVPVIQYEPGHPWFYLSRGDGQKPIPLEQIPAAECDGRFIEKLPKDPAKRRAKLEKLLADEIAHLAGYELHYNELIQRGAQALSEYDRAIAHGGDAELAVASSLALRFNHIANSRGRIRWLQSKLGLPLEFTSPADSVASTVADRSLADVPSGEQGLASAPGTQSVPSLRHDLAESPKPNEQPFVDSPSVVGCPPGQTTNNGGPMNTTESATENTTHPRQDKLDRVHETVEQALEQLATSLECGQSDTLRAWLKTMSKFHNYSLNNQMLIAWQRPDATHVAGFHAWKKFNRLVNKGEKGIMILAPITRVVGAVHESDDKGRQRERLIRQIVNAKVVHVFDVSQTHGDPLPEFTLVTGDPAAFSTRMKDFILAHGIELSFVERLPGGAQGISEGGRIGVARGLPPAEEFRTLVHEAAHELLHRGERRKETTKRSRELEAEAVAFVVCSGIGLEARQTSTDYIHLYRGDKAMLLESLVFIRKVSCEILAWLKSEDSTDSQTLPSD